MVNLFITRTPMQIVNAFEATQYFNTAQNILIIIENNQDNNPKQIQKVIEIFDLKTVFDDIIKVENRGKSKFIQSIELIKLLNKDQYDTVFLGSYGGIGKLLLANLEYQQSYLIDDGTATLIAHKTIMRNLNKTKIGFKELRALLFGLKIKIKKQIKFFTIFNLEQVENETIVKHSFENVKKRFSLLQKSDNTTYLLGQSLTDFKIVSKEKYLCYLQQIVDKYSDQKIIYMPHRAEILHKELYRLENENFTIMPNTMPIELYFLVNEIYPKHVISFFTSALYTLDVLFNKSKIESFYIDPSDIDNRVEIVKVCQDFLESTSVIKSPLENYKDYCLK